MFRIAEQEKVWARGQADVERPMSLNRAVYRTEAYSRFRCTPYGKRNTNSGLQYPASLAHSCIWVWEVTYSVVANHGIKTFIGKWERVGVAPFEFKRRVPIPRHGHLRRGKINPSCVCASLSCGGRDITRAGSYIEQSSTMLNGSIKQRTNRLCSQR